MIDLGQTTWGGTQVWPIPTPHTTGIIWYKSGLYIFVTYHSFIYLVVLCKIVPVTSDMWTWGQATALHIRPDGHSHPPVVPKDAPGAIVLLQHGGQEQLGHPGGLLRHVLPLLVPGRLERTVEARIDGKWRS